MLGMDVLDMENLEERLVGYRKGLGNAPPFGLGYLRLARELEPASYYGRAGSHLHSGLDRTNGRPTAHAAFINSPR